VAFYSDKHSVFRVNKPDAKGGSGMTQFGRALAELNIEILCANSSQAKGGVERANRALQDRLVKELPLADISDIDAGSAFLPEFVERFNEKFALPPTKAENLHRRLNVQVSNLADILCHREQRHLSQQLALAYDRRQIILERSELADMLAGQYVDVYDFADRPLEVRWKGHSLPYRVFSKDQRVSHAAPVESLLPDSRSTDKPGCNAGGTHARLYRFVGAPRIGKASEHFTQSRTSARARAQSPAFLSR
jgi:hypothetical protein